MRGGRPNGIAGDRAEPAPGAPIVDVRGSAAVLDLGELAAGGASAPLTVGYMRIWFTPVHGAVVDRAPVEPHALPRPRPAPIRLLPPQRQEGPGVAEALREVGERLSDSHVVHVTGPRATVGGLFCALARERTPPTEAVVYLDVRGAVLADILQVLFELMCAGPSGSVASADELRAGLRGVRGLVLLRDADFTVTEADIFGDTLRGCSIVIAGERGPSPDGVPGVTATAPSDEEMTPDVVELRVASLDASAFHALEMLIAAGGDAVHERVIAALLNGDEPAQRLRVLAELALAEANGPWHRAASSALQPIPMGLRPERWAGALATALAAWAHEARVQEATWTHGFGTWRRTHAWLLRDGQADRLAAARRLQEDVALAGRWGAWRSLLLDAVDHAETRGDTAGRAWALHQLGSRALCLGDRLAARACLAEARDLRWRTGDRAGAAVTQHNLDLASAGITAQASRRSRLAAWASRAGRRRPEPIG